MKQTLFRLALLFTAGTLLADDQPARRTDEQILQSVKLPDGYAATVFASPPQLGYPTAVSAAIDGMIFVATDENGAIGRDRSSADRKPGKVLRLRDSDGDGKADEVKVFAEVESPRGVIWDGLGADEKGRAPGTLYVMHPPNLTAYMDTDGDGVADRQEEILTGLGFDLGERGADHATNGCRLAIDGFIYIAVGDYGFVNARAKDGTTLTNRGGGIVRIRPDGTGFEIVSRGQRNIYDVAISPTLDLFTRDNNNDGGGWDVRLSFVPPGAQMGYPFLFKNFAEDMLQPIADYGGGSPCGALWIDEPGLQNGLYTVEWGRNAIMYHSLKQKGAGWETDGPDQGQTEWMKLTRPTDMDVDATGAIFITSWEGATFNYNGPNAGYVLRVVKKDALPIKVPDLARGELPELLNSLSSGSATLRLAAARQLALWTLLPEQRLGMTLTGGGYIAGGPFAIGLNEIMRNGTAPIGAQVAAIELYKRVYVEGFRDPASLDLRMVGEARPLLAEHIVRAIAVKPAEHIKQHSAQDQITRALSAPQPRVRAAAITALRRLGKADAAPQILPLVADADPVVAHLAFRALRELKAVEVCLGALDSADEKVKPGALQALYGMYDPAVVDGLIARGAQVSNLRGQRQSVPLNDHAGDQPATRSAAQIATGRADWKSALPFDLHRGILNALCRLANQDAPYKELKVWWGTRPDTTGPVYQPITWSETDKITAALKAALDASSEDDAKWLVERMYACKVAFPGLVEMMLTKAGNDTPAKLTAVEGLIRNDNSMPPQAIAALQSVTADSQQPPELRIRALRIFQRCMENGSVFPGVKTAFAPLAEHDLGDAGLTAVFEDFTRDGKNARWIGDYANALAADDAPVRQLAAIVLVNLSTGRVGGDDERKAAKKAVEKGFGKTESAVALLTAIARTGAKPLADQVKSNLNNPNNAVAEAALFAFQKLGLSDTTGKQIGTLKYDEVFTAVQTGGDAKAGQEMYLRAGCVACHTINPDEPPKGPMLSAVAKIYDRATLTESILKPNAKLAQGFESAFFKTKKDEQIEGFVTREGGDSVDVRNIVGQTVTLEKGDIVERGTRPQSMMPEGLLNAFTPAELANLLAYLESLKK